MCDKIKNGIAYIMARSAWPKSAALLGARLLLAKVFFKSGLVKIASWEATIGLFRDEYKVPLLSPEIAAYLGTVVELGAPILLLLGFLTPFAALALLGQALVIELFVYPGTPENYYWMALTAILITHGSGRLGVDYWLAKYILKEGKTYEQT